MTVLKKIEAKDAEGVLLEGGGIQEACESCHLKYWYPNSPPPPYSRRRHNAGGSDGNVRNSSVAAFGTAGYNAVQADGIIQAKRILPVVKVSRRGVDMRIRSVLFVGVVLALVATLALVGVAAAQAPARGAAPAPARGAAAGAQNYQLHGNLIQVMRGVLYPASNLIFFAQAEDPAAIKPARDAATATNPLESVYGGWQAVENAGIALAEGANLLMIPGRRCSNGRLAPMQDPNWTKWVQGLRAAGMASVKAAQSKSNDNMLEAADLVVTACANCHEKWRDVEPIINRCM